MLFESVSNLVNKFRSSRKAGEQSPTPLNQPFIDEKKKAEWTQAVVDSFQTYFNDPAKLAQSIIHRDSVRFDGMKLTDLTSNSSNVMVMLYALDARFSTIPSTQWEQCKKATKGYDLYVPSRLISWLKEVGFEDHEIKKMRLSDIVKYDAVIFAVLADSEHNQAYSDLNSSHCNNLSILPNIGEEQNLFKASLYPVMKQQIKLLQEKARSDKAPLVVGLYQKAELIKKAAHKIEVNPPVKLNNEVYSAHFLMLAIGSSLLIAGLVAVIVGTCAIAGLPVGLTMLSAGLITGFATISLGAGSAALSHGFFVNGSKSSNANKDSILTYGTR